MSASDDKLAVTELLYTYAERIGDVSAHLLVDPRKFD